MRLKGNAYFLILLIIVLGGMLAMSLRMDYLSSKLLPLMIGGVTLLLVLIGLVKELTGQGAPVPAEASHGHDGHSQPGLRAHLKVTAWVLGLALGIFLVGFLPASFIFIPSYMKRHRMSWLTTMVSAVLTTGLIYIVFELVLNLELYRGLLPY